MYIPYRFNLDPSPVVIDFDTKMWVLGFTSRAYVYSRHGAHYIDSIKHRAA